MASRIKAIGAYIPRIELGPRVGTREMANLITSRTGLNESEVWQALFELRDGVIFYNKQARPVQLEGLGTYTPGIHLDGTITVGHRADSEIKKQLNTPGEFRGTILRRENIGKSSEELVILWNSEHPDDPVE